MSVEAINAFQQAHKIIAFNQDGTPFLALAAHPEQKSAMNYLLEVFYGRKKTVESILMQHHLTYTKRDCNDCLSHNGQLMARYVNIYDLKGQQLTQDWDERLGRFMEGPYLLGWAHDDSGIYVGVSYDYVLGSRSTSVVDFLPDWPLPGPTIIKINVPEQDRQSGSLNDEQN